MKYIIFAAIIAIFFFSILPDPQNTHTSSYEAVSYKSPWTDALKAKIKKLAKKDEPKVKEAIFNGDSLYIGMYSDGTDRSGFAEYMCIKIKDKIKLPQMLYIKIVDYKDVLQNKGFTKIGEYFCKP